MKSDPERGFYCLDWEEENPFVIYGSETDGNYQRVELFLLPCSMVGSDLNQVEREPNSPNCNPNLEDQINYVGQSNLLVLVNKEKFNPRGFGDETIERFSSIFNAQFDEFKPSWMTIDVVKADV